MMNNVRLIETETLILVIEIFNNLLRVGYMLSNISSNDVIQDSPKNVTSQPASL